MERVIFREMRGTHTPYIEYGSRSEAAAEQAPQALECCQRRKQATKEGSESE